MTTFVLAQPKEAPMTKRIAELVIDSASNDYEDYNMIRREVEDWAGQEDVQYTEVELKNAIQHSIDNGLLQAYVYSKDEEQFKPCAFRIEDVDHVFFLATPKGRNILSS